MQTSGSQPLYTSGPVNNAQKNNGPVTWNRNECNRLLHHFGNRSCYIRFHVVDPHTQESNIFKIVRKLLKMLTYII